MASQASEADTSSTRIKLAVRASRHVKPKVSERLIVTKQSADLYNCGSSSRPSSTVPHSNLHFPKMMPLPRSGEPGAVHFPGRPCSYEMLEILVGQCRESQSKAAGRSATVSDRETVVFKLHVHGPDPEFATPCCRNAVRCSRAGPRAGGAWWPPAPRSPGIKSCACPPSLNFQPRRDFKHLPSPLKCPWTVRLLLSPRRP